MRAPRTVFSTDLRGGKRAAKARLRHLFAPRRRGLPPLALALAAVVLTAGLVACRPSPGQEPPNGTHPASFRTELPAVDLPLRAEGQIQEDSESRWFYFSYNMVGSGSSVLSGSIQNGGLEALDPFWPEIRAFLFPDNPDAGLAQLAEMAYRDHTEGGLQTCYVELLDHTSETMSSPYFQDTYSMLTITADSGARTLYRASHTAPDGTPMTLGDFFTVPEEEAAQRCLTLLLEQAADRGGPSAEELTTAFDPTRFYMSSTGLRFWFPADSLPSAGQALMYSIPYRELGDILRPLTDRPLLCSGGGYEDFYVVSRDGALVHLSGLDSYAEYSALQSPQATLRSGLYIRNDRIENSWQSPVWAEIDARYEALTEGLRESGGARDKALYGAWQAGGLDGTEYEEFCQYAHLLGQLLLYSEELSVGSPADNSVIACRGYQVYRHDTGEQLLLDDLFADPEEARARLADHLAGQIGLSAEEAAGLLSQEGYTIDANGRLTLLISGYDLGDISMDYLIPDDSGAAAAAVVWYPDVMPPMNDLVHQRLETVQSLGFSMVPGALSLPIPAEVTDGLYTDFIRAQLP